MAFNTLTTWDIETTNSITTEPWWRTQPQTSSERSLDFETLREMFERISLSTHQREDNYVRNVLYTRGLKWIGWDSSGTVHPDLAVEEGL